MIPGLLQDLRDDGVRITLDGDRIRVEGELSDAQRDALRQHRDLVLRILGLDQGDLGAWQRHIRREGS